MSKFLCALLLSLSALVLAIDANNYKRFLEQQEYSSWTSTESTSSGGTNNAFDIIEAEDYSNITSGMAVETIDGHTVVHNIKGGASIGYFKIDFGSGASRVEIRVHELADSIMGKCGMMYLHVGSSTHTPIAAVTMSYTTGPTKFVTLSQYLDTVPKGTLDLYLTFTSVYEDAYIIQIDYFQFFTVD